jgi:hypothetical protein
MATTRSARIGNTTRSSHGDVWAREVTGSAYGPFYIVDTTRGRVVSQPYHQVDEADRAMVAGMKSGVYSHRTHQVIDGRYLTDAAFGGRARTRPGLARTRSRATRATG